MEDGLAGAIRLSVSQKLAAGNLEIPRLPQVAGRVLELSRDPDSDLNALAATITTDPVLASRVITVANSAAFGTGHRVEALAAETGIEREGAFLLGLLHDIGKPVLVNSISEIEHKNNNRPLGLAVVEIVMSQLHEEVGAYVLGRWDMPASLVGATREHHRYRGAAHTTASQRLLYAGNLVCQHLGIGDIQRNVNFTVEHVFADLELADIDRCTAILDKVTAGMERMMAGLSEAA